MPVHNLKVRPPIGQPISYLNPAVQNFQVAQPLFYVMTPRAEETFRIPEPSIPFDQLDVEGLASWVESFANSKK